MLEILNCDSGGGGERGKVNVSGNERLNVGDGC